MSWLGGNLSNSSWGGSPPGDERLARLEVVVLSVLFASAALLNSGLLLALWRRRKRLSRMRVFVLHLCVADLVVVFFQVCPQLVWDITDRFVGPDLLCRAVKYLQVVGMFSSTYMMVAMTLDRHQAVCDPVLTFQRGRARWNGAVSAAWGAALAGGLPQLLVFSRVEVAPGVFDCWARFVQPWGPRAYVTWTTLVIFVLPVLTVLVCQVRICRALRARTGGGAGLSRARVFGAGLSRARVRTVRMTVVIVLAHVICWAPFFTVQLWSVWDEYAPTQSATSTILMLLASLNSCANPCIYLVFSGKLPRRLLALMCVGEPGLKTSMQEEATMVSSLYISLKGLSDCR